MRKNKREILTSVGDNGNWFELWLTQIAEHHYEEGWKHCYGQGICRQISKF